MEAELRTETTRTHLRRLLQHFGTTKLEKIGQQELDNAYKAILTKGIHATGATKLRAVLTPLRAVLEFAAIRGWRTITMVTRYAKKMPDVYRDEIKEWLGL